VGIDMQRCTVFEQSAVITPFVWAIWGVSRGWAEK